MPFLTEVDLNAWETSLHQSKDRLSIKEELGPAF